MSEPIPLEEITDPDKIRVWALASGRDVHFPFANIRDALDVPPYVETRTELKALNARKDKVAILTESGRDGLFIFRSGNLSSLVTADTQEGIYIKANGIASSSGAWVRQRDDLDVHVGWFGAVGNGATNDSAAIQAAITSAGPANASVWFSATTYIAVGLTITPTKSGGGVVGNVHLKGAGSRHSIIKRPTNTNGHLLTIAFIDQNATSGSSFRAAQTRITGIGFEGTPGTATTGYSINCPDGNVTAPNIGYGFAPWLDDVFIDASPEYGIYLGQYRDFGFFDRVVGLFTNSNVLFSIGNGDHTFVQCSMGVPLTAGADVAVFSSVFSTKLFGCDFHGAVQGSGVTVTGLASYVDFHNCVFNDNDQHGTRIFGGAALTDMPVQFHGCMWTDNSKQTNGTYHDILISDRARVGIFGPKYPTGAATNKPGYHVLVTGTCGDVQYEGHTTAAAGMTTLGITNNPLALTNCGVMLTTSLTQATITTGTGALTSATGSIKSIRQGNRITCAIACSITTNGTGATDIRFPLPLRTPLKTTMGVGYENGVSNALLLVVCPAAAAVAQVRFAAAGFAYPGANGAAIASSFEYEIAPSP